MSVVVDFILDLLLSWTAFVLGAVVLLAFVLASVPNIELTEHDDHEPDRHG